MLRVEHEQYTLESSRVNGNMPLRIYNNNTGREVTYEYIGDLGYITEQSVVYTFIQFVVLAIMSDCTYHEFLNSDNRSSEEEPDDRPRYDAYRNMLEDLRYVCDGDIRELEKELRRYK